MSIAIVTDSAAALPPELAARHGITVVPMWLTVRGVPEPEGRRPLEELVVEDQVTTSAPTPGEFEHVIKDASRTHDGVVVLTIASSMSATFQSAAVASQSVGGPVRVVDTATAGGAEALVVLAAAEAASAGGSLDAVEARAREVLDCVHLVATISSLDHLVRSGRVPGIAGWAGRRLGINPLFEFRDGAARRLRPALSRESAIDRIVQLVRREAPAGGGRLHVAALHALALDVAEELLARVTEAGDAVETFVGEFGPVMVVHTGPGLAGLAWWWEAQPSS
ncbi:MAG: DegV family protein [Acidimicrobiia bacterium]